MKTIKQFNEDFNSFRQLNYVDNYVDNAYYMDDQLKSDAIYWLWSLGGASGGSCWDEGPDDGARPFYGSSEPDETPLDRFLQEYFPDLKLKDYKTICSNVSHGTEHNHEYYGNYEDFATRTIHRKALLNLLQEAGCVELS